MSDDTHSGHNRIYLVIGLSLLILTGVTVGASYIELSLPLTITLALIIATFKASLVAGYFMHLLNEKKLIYWLLFLTFAFFFVLLLLPIITHSDPYGQGY